jgi:hypothetical protein
VPVKDVFGIPAGVVGAAVISADHGGNRIVSHGFGAMNTLSDELEKCFLFRHWQLVHGSLYFGERAHGGENSASFQRSKYNLEVREKSLLTAL